MKALRWIVRVLTAGLFAAAIVLFFFPFAKTILTNGADFSQTGAMLAFGGSVDVQGESVQLAKSLYYMLVFIVTVIGAICAGFGIKKKGAGIAAPVFSLISTIFMLMFMNRSVAYYVDIQPYTTAQIQNQGYYLSFYLCLIALAAATVIGVLTIFINDLVEVRESNGQKKTLIRRFVRWLLDYKSELKKIVWPSRKEVIKNTIVVLIMCVAIGIIVWLLDWGLVELLKLFIGKTA